MALFRSSEVESGSGDDKARDPEAGEKAGEREECESREPESDGDVSLHAETAGVIAIAASPQPPRLPCSDCLRRQ